jgi:hypothetical protein
VDEEINCTAAAMFMQQACDAHERGDYVAFSAARKLIMVALGVGDPPPPLMRRPTAKPGPDAG